MAIDTPVTLRNLVLYSVYVRNHGPHGTFADVEADLPRIHSMNVDVIWLMPIHPIGKIARKGTLGSPYSIADYRAVNPEYGTREDLTRLIEKAHSMGMRVIIDVVYNHTAHDSVLVKEHPGWYHQNAEGQPVTTVPAWSDIIDLKYPNPDLEEYLIESLEDWVRMGVDGFRCDVASLVPIEFWMRARERVAQINPQAIWLAESVHAGFVGARRETGLRAFSDSEVYHAFDICYDYDIWPIWQAAVTGQAPVERYLEMLRFQGCIYPANWVKLRCVENHDQARIMALAPSRPQAIAWTAFMAFNKGPFMIYAGQEAAATHTPSLFEDDKVVWGSNELQPLLTALALLKKEPAMRDGIFTISAGEPCIVATWEASRPEGVSHCLLGIFNIAAATGLVNVPLPDGEYQDVLSGAPVSVRYGQASIPDTAVVIAYDAPLNPRWFYSHLLDMHIPSDSAG